MTPGFLIALVWLVACALPTAVHAETQVRVDSMDPPDGSTLAPYQPVYVRIEYTTDEPVSLWARPFLRGQQVKTAQTNASPTYSGSGAALGWVTLVGNGEVDEIRVRAGGGTPYREWEVASLPVSLSWQAGAASASRQAEPAWVGTLRADADARGRAQAAEAAANTTTGDILLFNGFMLTMLAVGVAGLVVPLWYWFKWRGAWRVAAALPAGIVMLVLLNIAVGTSLDPTSHNLWPFEVVMASGLALVLIGALKLARRFTGSG